MAGDKVEHLKLIQGVIDRMARNSFHLKGWSVALVSALFALAAADTNQAHLLQFADPLTRGM